MKSVKGVTLIELLITIAVLAILLGASTSMGKIYQSQRSAVVIDELKKLVSYARLEAIHSGTFVTICPTKDQISCEKNWNLPIIAFQDNNHNKVIDGSETIGRILKPLRTGETLTLSASAGRKYLRYNSRGIAHGTFGNILFCNSKNEAQFARMLVINRMGRAREAIDYDGDGVVEAIKGSPISCT